MCLPQRQLPDFFELMSASLGEPAPVAWLQLDTPQVGPSAHQTSCESMSGETGPQTPISPHALVNSGASEMHMTAAEDDGVYMHTPPATMALRTQVI